MNPPEPVPAPVPAPSETIRRKRKTMDEIRRVGLMSSMSLPTETELLHDMVEAAQPPASKTQDSKTQDSKTPASKTPASKTSPAPLRVARSPHPLDNFSFDQLCPADDDESAQSIVGEADPAIVEGEAPAIVEGGDPADSLDENQDTARKAVRKPTAERQKDLPKGPFKGPTNKASRPPGERKPERFVPKTMLDHNLILQNLAVSVAKSQEKLAQKVAEKEAEPPKPCIPIENYKMAQKNCPFTWGEMDAPKERFRYCDKCKTPVYNFAGMDLPEAEELIFKREERRNAPLFKRADGKFMTRDCPVALKEKYGLAMMIAGGILVLAILAGLSMLMPAPPPKPAEAPSNGVTPQAETMPSQLQPGATQTGLDGGQGSVNQGVPPVTQPATQPVAPPVEPPVQMPYSPSDPGS